MFDHPSIVVSIIFSFILILFTYFSQVLSVLFWWIKLVDISMVAGAKQEYTDRCISCVQGIVPYIQYLRSTFLNRPFILYSFSNIFIDLVSSYLCQLFAANKNKPPGIANIFVANRSKILRFFSDFKIDRGGTIFILYFLFCQVPLWSLVWWLYVLKFRFVSHSSLWRHFRFMHICFCLWQ